MRGLCDGTLEVIATDHAPHAPEKKMRELDQAPNGIIGLETLLPICIQALIETKRLTWPQLIEKLTINPAKVLGIDRGTLKPGAVADVTIIDPTAEWTIDPSKFRSKSRNCPWAGQKVRGRAETVLVGRRGQVRAGGGEVRRERSLKMSRPNGEARIQKNSPPKVCADFTGDRPLIPTRRQRRFNWLIVGPIVFGVLAVAVLIAGYETDFFKYGLTGYPTTPMTVEKAEQMASRGPPAGSSLEEVEAWLTLQGVAYRVGPPKGEVAAEQWEFNQGNQTDAVRAALKTSEVSSYVCVTYPDADRAFLEWDGITVFFFFDSTNRLIKHWVNMVRVRP